jgi:hypothetical protein
MICIVARLVVRGWRHVGWLGSVQLQGSRAAPAIHVVPFRAQAAERKATMLLITFLWLTCTSL